jgi:hypothetical protein
MRFGALTALALAVLATGCAMEAPRERSTRIEIVPHTKPTTRIVGGSPRQRALLHQIHSGIGPTRIKSVAIVSDRGRDPDGPQHAVAYEAKADTNVNQLAAWQADVVGKVFARHSHQLHLPPVTWIADDAGGYASYGPDLYAPLAKTPLTMNEAAIDLERAVEKAHRHGAKVRVRVLHPDRLAFVLVFQADDAADFLRNGLEPTLEWIRSEDHERYDGLYVEVVDARGQTVYAAGAGLVLRGVGASCAHYQTGIDFGPPYPPPCPVTYRGP